MKLRLLPLLPLLLSLLCQPVLTEETTSEFVKIEYLTREIPLIDDTNFLVQCSVAPALLQQVKQIYFLWGDQMVAEENSTVTGRVDFGNGTLQLKSLMGQYNFLQCYVRLHNGTELRQNKIFMTHYPLCYVISQGEKQQYVTSFQFERELRPGYQTAMSCYGHCSCQFEQSWYIRIDDNPEELLQLDKEVRDLAATLYWKTKPELYGLMFEQIESKSTKAVKQVPAGSRVQVICRIKAFKEGDGAMKQYPVLKYVPDTANGIFNMLLPPPPEVVTTEQPIVERCEPLSSALPDKHVCRPHLRHLLSNGTWVSANLLLNATSVLPPDAAARADSPHLAHCAALAQALLCSSALCSDRPCKQHCLLVRDHVCPGEVKLLRQFPDCGRFPDADAEPACKARFDLESVMLRHSRPAKDVLESEVVLEPRACFSRRDFWRGLFYRQPGDQQPPLTTNCANWSSASNRLLSAEYFASLRGAGHDCRNPGAQFHRPSCIDRSDTRFFVTCQVTECPEDQLSPSLAGFGSNSALTAASVAAGIAAVIAVCGVVILVVLLRKRRRAKKTEKDQGEEAVSLAQSHQGLSGDGVLDGSVKLVQRNVKFGQKTHLAKTYPKLERLAYSHDDFADLGKMIGKGAFFTVHLVETTKYKEERPDMPKLVALKVLDETADDQIVESFFSEAELLLGMEHRYIMQVFGICASTRPFCLLVEYCEFGDLQTLLRKTARGELDRNSEQNHHSHLGSAPNGQSRNVYSDPTAAESLTSTSAAAPASPTSAAEPRPRPLELADLLRMASQVANALSYISKRGLVFRDLACRNILVTSGYDIRLADFGMCRKLPLGSRTACVVSESECLPVRWLAPETVSEGRFYPESDVYAFGVLLWELFSMGEQPWTGYSVERVWEMKLQDPDSHLPRPAGAPENVWTLMRACWASDRAARPGFSSLTYQLHQAATHC